MRRDRLPWCADDAARRRAARSSCVRDALDQAARVDEDDRRAVRADELGDAVVDRRPAARGSRSGRARGRWSRRRGRARAGGRRRRWRSRGVPSAASRPAPTSRRAISLDRLLRRRQADALQRPAGERVEALERQRQVRAALVAGDGVDLVDDHGRGAARAASRLLLGGEQDVERLGRRDEDVRRAPHHRLALARRACRRCAPRRGSRAACTPRRDGARADLGERLLRGSSGCRCRAPSAARRRRPMVRVGEAAARAARTSSSIAQRNAASVLPEPVGAAISVSRRRRWRASRRAAAASARRSVSREPAGDERIEADSRRRAVCALHPPSVAPGRSPSEPPGRGKLRPLPVRATIRGWSEQRRRPSAGHPAAPGPDAAARSPRASCDACAPTAIRRCSPAAACATWCSDSSPRTTTSPPRRPRARCSASSRAPCRSASSSASCWCSRAESTFQVATFRRDGVYLDHRHPVEVHFADARRRRRAPRLHHQRHVPRSRVRRGDRPRRRARRPRGRRGARDRRPHARFDEDSLRLLRAVRFAARFGYAIDARDLRRDPQARADHHRHRLGADRRRDRQDPHRGPCAARLRAARRDRAAGHRAARDRGAAGRRADARAPPRGRRVHAHAALPREARDGAARRGAGARRPAARRREAGLRGLAAGRPASRSTGTASRVRWWRARSSRGCAAAARPPSRCRGWSRTTCVTCRRRACGSRP